MEATLDGNSTYHLFPIFSNNRDFEGLFNYQVCFFGKKTSQERISKDDYKLLEKIFKEWKDINVVSVVDWKDIHQDFTEGLTSKWINSEFSYEQTKEWIGVGLEPNDCYLATYLRDILSHSPGSVLNFANLGTLRGQYQEYSQSKKKLDLGKFSSTYQNVFYATNYFNQVNEQLPEVETDENSSEEEGKIVAEYQNIIRDYKFRLLGLNSVSRRLSGMLRSIINSISLNSLIDLTIDCSLSDNTSPGNSTLCLTTGVLESLTDIEDAKKAVNQYMIGIAEKVGGVETTSEGTESLELLVQEFWTFVETMAEIEREGRVVASEFLLALNNGNMECFLSRNRFARLIESSFQTRNDLHRLRFSKNKQIVELNSQVDELRQALSKLQEENFKYKLKVKEDKLEVFVQRLGIDREKSRKLRRVYQKLIKAREDFDQSVIVLMEDEIEKIKDGLLSGEWLTWKVGLEDTRKFCSKCEKIAKLKVDLEKLCQRSEFQAQQEVSYRK